MAWHGHTVILGRTGSGKTYYLHNTIIPKLAAAGVPVFLWLGGHDENTPPVPSIFVDGTDNVDNILKILDESRFIICYRPDLRQKVANQELFFWQKTLMTRTRKRLIFILDEAQRYAPQGSIDTGAHILATGSRKHGIECYFVCQRVAELSKTIAAQCQHWIIFEHSRIDTDYLLGRGIQLSENELKGLSHKRYSYLFKVL